VDALQKDGQTDIWKQARLRVWKQKQCKKYILN